MKKNSEEWNEILMKPKGITILDPDGWDRKNFEYSWYEELITEQEFNKRMVRSTLISSQQQEANDEG